MTLLNRLYVATHNSHIFHRLYDITHPKNPNCAGCGYKYGKSATLNFEYNHGQREVNFPLMIQPQESLNLSFRVLIDPKTVDPKTGHYYGEIRSARINKSGIRVCFTCAQGKRRDRLTEDLYAYMQRYWTKDRLPDLEELMLTATISLD